jgi:hypothetical protein
VEITKLFCWSAWSHVQSLHCQGHLPNEAHRRRISEALDVFAGMWHLGREVQLANVIVSEEGIMSAHDFLGTDAAIHPT